MSIELSAPALSVPRFSPAATAAPKPSFHLLREGRCGIEIRHQDGAIFAFMLNSTRTGLIDCRRPYESADHELYRAAARRFAERHAHDKGLIFCRTRA